MKNGPKLKATGYFRVLRYQGKWWLVDPEGRLFWSTGIDVLRTHTDATQEESIRNGSHSLFPRTEHCRSLTGISRRNTARKIMRTISTRCSTNA
ncbi:MAG: hypothetical protein V8T87_06005 [Victivallales bacterium]